MYTATDFAIVLQKNNLTDTGDYVIIAVDKDDAFDPKWLQGFCSDTHAHPYTEGEGNSKACRSLLLLTPTANQDDNFRDEVVRRTSEDPFNIPRNPIIQRSMKLPVYGALAYDAVMLLATALTRAYDTSVFPHGTEVIKQMFNMKYESEFFVTP